jgi:ribosomal protein L32
MSTIILAVVLLDLINAALVSRYASARGLSGSEWAILAVPLFPLVWIPLAGLSAGAVSETAPALATPDADAGGTADDPVPGTPLMKPQEVEGVALSDFRPKAEITDRDYAATRTQALEAAPSAATGAKRRRKRKRNDSLKVIDEERVTCPNCQHETHPNAYGLCPYCGVRLK